MFAALDDRGYRVLSQVEVGAYRIDLVVEGTGARVAVECDSDHFHPIEDLEEDLERQGILERLGWRLVRLRGSAFYRRPEREIEHLCKRLQELRVEPLGRVAVQVINEGDALRERVRGSAADIRQRWLADAGSLDGLFEQVVHAGRRSWRGAPRIELVRRSQ